MVPKGEDGYRMTRAHDGEGANGYYGRHSRQNCGVQGVGGEVLGRTAGGQCVKVGGVGKGEPQPTLSR